MPDIDNNIFISVDLIIVTKFYYNNRYRLLHILLNTTYPFR